MIIPSSLTKLQMNVFKDCTSLVSVFIPTSIVSIDDHAFSGCSSLLLIAIPASVVHFGVGIFHECSTLEAYYEEDQVANKNDGPNDDKMYKWLRQRFFNLPIHEECYYNLQHWTKDGVSDLITKFGATLLKKDSCGLLPLDILCWNISTDANLIQQILDAMNTTHSRKKGIQSEDHQLQSFLRCRHMQEIHKLIVEKEQTLLASLLEQGISCNDLKCICALDESGFMSALTVTPQAMSLENEEGFAWYPFMLAANLSQCKLETVYFLALKCPDRLTWIET